MLFRLVSAGESGRRGDVHTVPESGRGVTLRPGYQREKAGKAKRNGGRTRCVWQDGALGAFSCASREEGKAGAGVGHLPPLVVPH